MRAKSSRHEHRVPLLGLFTSSLVSLHPWSGDGVLPKPLAYPGDEVVSQVGFPCGSGGKEFTCNVGDLGSVPGLGRFRWRRERLPTSVFWPGELHGLYSPWGRKESDPTFTSDFPAQSPVNCQCWRRLLRIPWATRRSNQSLLKKVKVAQSNSLRPYGLYSPCNSPGQNTGVGSLSLLQGFVPTQGSSPGLLHCRQLLYPLSHKGSPR